MAACAHLLLPAVVDAAAKMQLLLTSPTLSQLLESDGFVQAQKSKDTFEQVR
jgi:hypothetical protein